MFSFECYDMLAMSSCYSASSIRYTGMMCLSLHWFMYVNTGTTYMQFCVMETVIKAYFQAHISCGLMMQSFIGERNNVLAVVGCKITLLTVLKEEILLHNI